jgi:hypothetical protein
MHTNFQCEILKRTDRLERSGVFYLFIYALFNDAVGSSDYISSGDRMIN